MLSAFGRCKTFDTSADGYVRGEGIGAHTLGERATEAVRLCSSAVRHDGRTLFAGLPNPVVATRYHSLVVEREGLPDCLEVSAESEDETIMGIRHRDWPLEGVQFHPESILTLEGKRILANFLRI